MSISSDVEYGMGRVEAEFFRRGVLPIEAHEALREATTPINQSPHTWSLASRVLKNEGSRDVSKAEEAVGVALRLGIGHLKASHRKVQGDVRIGAALGNLKNLSTTTFSHRLGAITKTHDLYVVEHHLSSLLALLAGTGNNPQFSVVNYGQLAHDLLEWQDPNLRSRVTTRWVKDAYTTLSKEPFSA